MGNETIILRSDDQIEPCLLKQSTYIVHYRQTNSIHYIDSFLRFRNREQVQQFVISQ